MDSRFFMSSVLYGERYGIWNQEGQLLVFFRKESGTYLQNCWNQIRVSYRKMLPMQ